MVAVLSYQEIDHFHCMRMAWWVLSWRHQNEREIDICLKTKTFVSCLLKLNTKWFLWKPKWLMKTAICCPVDNLHYSIPKKTYTWVLLRICTPSRSSDLSIKYLSKKKDMSQNVLNCFIRFVNWEFFSTRHSHEIYKFEYEICLDLIPVFTITIRFTFPSV